MRKFAAALVAVVLASFVTLFGVVAPTQAIGTADCVTVAGVSTAGYIGAPSLSSTAYYIYPTQGSAYTTSPTFTPAGFTGSVVYTTSPALPSGMTINSSTGAITGTPTQSTSATVYKIQATGTPSVTPPGHETSYCAANEISIQVWASGGGGGGGGQMTNTPFTFASSSIAPNASVSNLNNGDAMPGFTATASGVSSGGKYNLLNIAVGDLRNGKFFTVANPSTNTSFNSYGAWDPSTRNCGITRVVIGGVAQTASSGVTCEKLTSVNNGQNQYWVSLKLAAFSTADFSIDVADGLFTAVNPANADIINVFASYPDTVNSVQYNGSFGKTLNEVSPGRGSASTVDTLIALPTGIGQPIAGQTVGINATNLALNTNYSVVLRSTPQILEQGTTTATFMNTTVTIPAGLEPGWHSITFSAVRSDGVATEQVAYFKISDSGMLLQTSAEVPAELAFTAAPKGEQWSLGVILAMLGLGLIAAVYTYRRRVFEMVYVLTGNGGHYDIELVEQPKNARYLPMRPLKK